MKNDGYTYIEIIAAIAILSILFLGIIPQLRTMEMRGFKTLSTAKDNTQMTQLVNTLTTEISDIHWNYWQPPPMIENIENGVIIRIKTEAHKEWGYRIRREKNSIVIESGEIKRIYTFSDLIHFKVTTENLPDADFNLEIRTPSQSLTLPLHFGSKAIEIPERI